MHPRPFDYRAVTSVEDAVAALEDDGEARLLAGGQSLVPRLSLGERPPTRLIDINGVGLAGLDRHNGSVAVGATTRHRELERSSEAAELLPLLAEAVQHVGNPQVRNRGTFGGSLSHADPRAELCAAALAHGGTVVLAGPAGERDVPIDDYLLHAYATAQRHEEILVRAELRLPPPASGTAFVEVARRADDFAVAGAAAIVTMDEVGRACADARIAVMGATPTAVRAVEAEEACRGAEPGPELLEAVARAVSRSVRGADDPFVSGAYRARCAVSCARHAVARATERARAAMS
jgi:CO/xanthine dehydrogenase FAD-binding subunit